MPREEIPQERIQYYLDNITDDKLVEIINLIEDEANNINDPEFKEYYDKIKSQAPRNVNTQTVNKYVIQQSLNNEHMRDKVSQYVEMIYEEYYTGGKKKSKRRNKRKSQRKCKKSRRLTRRRK
jgi:hypothetical protein